MARCEVCGNDYDKSFEVIAAGVHHTFDSFECAVHRMAPVCEHCGCKVVGHGVEVDGRFYCCAHCARAAEDTDAPIDRVDTVAGSGGASRSGRSRRSGIGRSGSGQSGIHSREADRPSGSALS